MVDVNILGVGMAQFPDEMPVNDMRTFLQRKFPPIAQPQGFQPSLTTQTAGGAPLSAVDPFQIEAIEMQQRQQALQERQALQFPDPTQQEPGLGQVVIPGIEDTPADIAFTAKAIQEGDIKAASLGLAGIAVPGLSAAKLGAVIPLLGKAGAKSINDTGEKVFKIRSGGANHKIDSQGRTFRFNKRREEWIDISGTPGEANTLKRLDEINNAGGLEAFESGKSQRVEAIREEANKQRVISDETFKLQHQAPTVTGGSGVAGVDVNSTMPDIYGPNGLQFYGTGLDYDQKALSVIKSMKGKPGKTVTIYRAVPKEIGTINPGDWVATTREYAVDHLGTEKNWHILTKKVKAKDIATDGNSIHEWGYDPR